MADSVIKVECTWAKEIPLQSRKLESDPEVGLTLKTTHSCENQLEKTSISFQRQRSQLPKDLRLYSSIIPTLLLWRPGFQPRNPWEINQNSTINKVPIVPYSFAILWQKHRYNTSFTRPLIWPFRSFYLLTWKHSNKTLKDAIWWDTQCVNSVMSLGLVFCIASIFGMVSHIQITSFEI